MSKSQVSSFTGRRTRHQTRWSVRAADRISSFIITVGGIGTIIAVSFVFVVLVSVVWPLFGTADVSSPARSSASVVDASLLHVEIDEYRSLGWAIHSTGDLVVFRLDTGEALSRRKLVEDDLQITAFSIGDESKVVTLGFSDGTARIGEISFRPTFLDPDQVPPELEEMQPGDVRALDDGVVQVTPLGQHRKQSVYSAFGEPLEIGQGVPVRSIDRVVASRGSVLAALLEDGTAQLLSLRERRNSLTGESTYRVARSELPRKRPDNMQPCWIKITGRGDSVLVICAEGWLARFDTRTPSSPVLAEELSLLEGVTDARISVVDFAIGRETLLVGDTRGNVGAWARVRSPLSKASDSNWLMPIHELPAQGSGVTSLGKSKQSRMLAVGYDDGTVRVFHVTTDQLMAELAVGDGKPIERVAIAPKDDGLFALSDNAFWTSEFDPAYPEATWSSLFLPVWYEGFSRPEMIWQSSFAGVESEMKLSLRPLIFGTIKATVYSMIFGAPLALLAAIYTSEFTRPRSRAVVKSLIEMMASLPSVVLGFLAALVIAPFIATMVPATLCMFLTIPTAILMGAYLWQQLPHRTALRFPWVRLPAIGLSIVVGVFAGWRLGPWFERVFFGGDFFLWLDGQRGDGTGAWMIMFLPLCGILMATTIALWINPWLRRASADWSRRSFTLANLAKFLAATVCAFLFALLLSRGLVALDLDPRGSFVDTYDNRNALIVGFVMGFAIIPIIYTISEDALATVPAHLRSASLGAGATPWQTAVRVVIPTAVSGLFSALMIGLGRAVGETMIVLMAAGNIPVMEWNMFNGFRTLSANIAVELPEAVEFSTHYRTLFLAALTLFVLTFIVNTMAELVRLRFRKRAVRL